MLKDRRPKRDRHVLTAEGMVLCNPRAREAAHRAQMEGTATDVRAAVTCRNCRALFFQQHRDRGQTLLPEPAKTIRGSAGFVAAATVS